MKYRVHYIGCYVIEADSLDEAIETDRNDFDVEFDEWDNYEVEEIEEIT